MPGRSIESWVSRPGPSRHGGPGHSGCSVTEVQRSRSRLGAPPVLPAASRCRWPSAAAIAGAAPMTRAEPMTGARQSSRPTTPSTVTPAPRASSTTAAKDRSLVSMATKAPEPGGHAQHLVRPGCARRNGAPGDRARIEMTDRQHAENVSLWRTSPSLSGWALEWSFTASLSLLSTGAATRRFGHHTHRVESRALLTHFV